MRAQWMQAVASVRRRPCASDSVQIPGNSLNNARVFVPNVSKVPTVTGMAGVRGLWSRNRFALGLHVGPWLMALVNHIGPWFMLVTFDYGKRPNVAFPK